MGHRARSLTVAVAVSLTLVVGSSAARQDPASERRAAAEAELERLRAAHGDGETLELAAQTGKVARARRAAGDSSGALEAYRETLAMTRRLGLGDHPLAQAALLSIGVVAVDLGRADEAVAAHEQSIAMARRLAPGDHEATAVALRSFGSSLLTLGRFSEAEEMLRDALAMETRLPARDVEREVLVRRELANCLAALGRAGEALEQTAVEVELRRRSDPPSPATLAAALDDRGQALRAFGFAEKALHAHREALEILRGLDAGDAGAERGVRMHLADDLTELGRNAEARPLFEAALVEARARSSGDDPEVATALNALARCIDRMGDTAEALPLFEEALAMRRRLFGNEHPDVAQSLGNLAFCYTRLGRLDDAIDLHREALALRRRLSPGDHSSVANSLVNLAHALESGGRLDEALPLYEEQAAMVARLYGERSPLAVATWLTLAGCLGEAGREEEALSFGERALAESRRLFGDGADQLGPALNAVAISLANLGRVEEALPLLEEALAIERRLERGSGLDTALMNVAAMHLLAERPAEAAERYAEVIARIEARRAAASGLEERDRARYFASLRRGSPYLGMVWAQVALGRPDEGLRYLEQGRARTLLDLLERRRVDPFAEALRVAERRGDEEAARALREVEAGVDDARRAVERTTYELVATQKDERLDRAARGARLAELDALRRAALEEEREAQRRRARAVQNQLPLGRPATPEEIRRLPGRGERLLTFGFLEDHGVLFLVPPAGEGDIEVFPLEVRTTELEETVAALRDAWSRPDGVVDRGKAALPREGASAEGRGADATGELSHHLFRSLFPDAAWASIRAASRVDVVPEGPLHDLPLEALAVGFEDGAPRFWLDDGPPVSYAPSATVLLSCRSNRDARRSERMPLEVLALGDPVYGVDPDDAEVPELGAWIVGVDVDSNAERAGLRVGDVIVAYDGAPVNDDRALRDRIQALANAVEDGERPAGATPALAWVRDGVERSVDLPAGPLGVRVARGPAGEAVRQGLASGDPASAVERAGLLLRYGDLAPLPGTRRELAALYESFTGVPFDPRTAGDTDGVRLLLGAAANEAELFRWAPRARIVHLAAHYLADEGEFAGRSALALTLPRTPSAQDDGFLSVGDVMERWRGRLDGCELVVLSACETARGERRRHEGVFAMPWGLFYAGVPAVIVSHWRVGDDSTAALMAEFYRRLRSAPGVDKLEAFTEARRAIRARFPAPFHWAPFVYLGDPR